MGRTNRTTRRRIVNEKNLEHEMAYKELLRGVIKRRWMPIYLFSIPVFIRPITCFERELAKFALELLGEES